MSKTIDQRVVEMRFDNKQFESNASTTMSTLDKLKKSLNLTGASKGLEDVSAAAKRCDLSPISKGVEVVRTNFSALEVMAVTALANITNSAVNAGKRIVSALTIDPIKTGFQEYETQINAIQTILANTSHEGATLEQVNSVLDELNSYADKTIYNFTEMTKNIGTFTAAGVGLNESAEAIKGIANLAAMSGSTSAQASTAMYQLSQALASGTVNLQDWNSVVNAGMGGKVFQDALIKTAAAMKGVSEETFRAENVTGSFRDSINAKDGTGWLNAEVLLNTLRQFTGDLSTAELKLQGFTDKQIVDIQKMAQTANDAATKVKTFTQLWDTLKESAQSGWTQTWEILVGDFEEAKTLLTELSDTIGGLIGESAESRNTLLYDSMTSNWKKITDGISEAGMSADTFKEKVTEIGRSQVKDFDKIVEDYGSLEEAFKSGAISSEILDKALISMTGTSEEVSKKLKELSGDYKTNDDIIKALTKAGYEYSDIQNLITKDTEGQTITLNDLTDAQLMSIGYTEEQVLSIRKLSEQAELANGSLKSFMDNVAVPQGRELFVDSLRTSLNSLIDIFKAVGQAWKDVFPPMSSDQLLGIIASVNEFIQSIKPSEETLNKIQRSFRGLFSILSLGKQAISAVISPFGELLGGVGKLSGGILELTASFGDWLYSLNNASKTGEFFSTLSDGLRGFLQKIKEATRSIIDNFDGFGGILSSMGETISNVFGKIFDVVSRVVNWIRENISAGDIFAGFAGGGIFIAFKKFGSLIDKVKEFFEGFGNLGEGATSGFKDVLGSVHDALDGFSEGIQVASLVGIATAVTLLTSSLQKISELKPKQIGYSLVTIRLLIASLNSGFKSLTKTLSKFNAKGTIKASVAMIAISEAVNILADALVVFSDLSLEEITKGLITVGGALLELTLALKIIDGAKISLRSSIALIALAKACQMLSKALVGFSQLDWDEIGRGLSAMGGALLELSISLGILSKVGGGGAFLGSLGILVAVQALDEISENLKKLGNLSWEQIGKGLVAMGGAFGELSIALGILSKVGGFGSILGGTAILITVQSLDEISENLERLGKLSWEQIGKGLSAMGGALAELGTVTGVLGKLAGFSGILGAGSLLIAVQSLEKLADALEKFGSMQWDEIGRGLVAMGGALLEVGAVNGALGKIAGISGIFGAGSIWITVQGLEDLSISLKSFAEMSWDEIGRGLVAMGGALLEVGGISGGLGALSGFAGILGGASIWVTVQGLEDLANAFKKFALMDWDEIGRGLSAMGGALAETALGGLLNTFSGLGASAIAEMAGPLGDLADSVKKWSGVTVPDGLNLQLGSLANGVKAFTFGGLGADAIAAVAIPIGDMADSIRRWQGISVPAELGTQIGSLANGVKAFTFGGLGANAIASVAIPLGDMADAVKKWSDVTIPGGLEEGLSSIANGVKAFSFAFVGGWSMDSIKEPLIDLSDAVKKWKDVTIPIGIDKGLTALADGVKAFSFAFVGGWSIDSIKEPLGDLADSVRKWNGIYIAGIGPQLAELAGGLKVLKEADINAKFNKNIKEFFNAFANESIGVAVYNIGSLVTALGQMASIDSNGITTFSTALENLGNVSVSGLVTSLQNGAEQAGSAVNSVITTMQSSLFNGSITLGQAASNVGKTISTDLTNGLNTGLSGLPKAISSVIASASAALRSQSAAFKTIGTMFGTNLVESAKVSMSGLSKSLSNSVTLAISAINEKANSFREAGVQMISKLVSGFQTGTNALKVAASTTITSLLSVFSNSHSQFNSSGVNIVIQITKGVTSQQTSLILVFTSLIEAALTTIKNKYVEFESAGQNIMVKLIAGIRSKDSAVRTAFTSSLSGAASSIRNYYNDFYSAGAYLAEGLADGIRSNIGMVEDAVGELGDAASGGLKYGLKINSPSKVSYEDGAFFSLGFIKAIFDNNDRVYKAGSEMATSANKGLTNAISKIKDVIDGNIDTQPTIRPVLDLSNVESGTAKLSALFSRTQAMSISTGMNREVDTEIQNGDSDPSTKGANYHFVQNNYSPKSLSRVEIYRQTKNQFSAFERMVKA